MVGVEAGEQLRRTGLPAVLQVRTERGPPREKQRQVRGPSGRRAFGPFG